MGCCPRMLKFGKIFHHKLQFMVLLEFFAYFLKLTKGIKKKKVLKSFYVFPAPLIVKAT